MISLDWELMLHSAIFGRNETHFLRIQGLDLNLRIESFAKISQSRSPICPRNQKGIVKRASSYDRRMFQKKSKLKTLPVDPWQTGLAFWPMPIPKGIAAAFAREIMLQFHWQMGRSLQSDIGNDLGAPMNLGWRRRTSRCFERVMGKNLGWQRPTKIPKRSDANDQTQGK